jgi:hypothetical protein
MTVIHEHEAYDDLGQVAGAGIHLAQPAQAPCCEPQDGHNDEHGFQMVEAIRVVFVALAAAAVWFRLWEPFHSVSMIGIAAALIGG